MEKLHVARLEDGLFEIGDGLLVFAHREVDQRPRVEQVGVRAERADRRVDERAGFGGGGRRREMEGEIVGDDRRLHRRQAGAFEQVAVDLLDVLRPPLQAAELGLQERDRDRAGIDLPGLGEPAIEPLGLGGGGVLRSCHRDGGCQQPFERHVIPAIRQQIERLRFTGMPPEKLGPRGDAFG